MHLTARGETRRLSLVPQRALQQAPAAEQATHHRPFGHPGRLSNFVVAQAFNVRQLHRGPKLWRQLVDGSLDCVGSELVEHRAFDIG